MFSLSHNFLFFTLAFLWHSLRYSAEATLARCQVETDFPSRVTLAGIQVSTLNADYLPNEELSLASEVGLILFNEEQERNNATTVKVEWHRTNITSALSDKSGAEMMQAALDVFEEYQARSLFRSSSSPENLVAVAGGFAEHWSEAINLVSQLYGYPHLDISDGPGMSDLTRYPMYSRFLSSSIEGSKVYLEFLKHLNVSRVAVLDMPETKVESVYFQEQASTEGIEIVMSATVDETASELQSNETITAMKENNVHYVIVFLKDGRFAAFLGHWYLAGLTDEAEGKPKYEVVWMGHAVRDVHNIFPTFVTANPLEVHEIYQDFDIPRLLDLMIQYPVFRNEQLYDWDTFPYLKIFESLKGSFGAHNADFRANPEEDYVSEFFIDKMIERGMLLPRLSVPAIADMGLTLGRAVRDMVHNGYGCHLHAHNFTHEASKMLHRHIVSQKFRGNSGWVEFDSNGDRLWSTALLSFHPGNLESQTDNIFFNHVAYIPNNPVEVAVFNSSQDMKRFESRTIIWPNGVSPENPGTPLWDGSLESNSTSDTEDIDVVVEYQGQEYKQYFFVVMGLSLCGISLVGIGMWLFWRRYKQVIEERNRLLEDAQEKVMIDVAAPVEKVVTMIQDMLKGNIPSKEELVNLQGLLKYGNIMVPNLAAQFDASGTFDMYSKESIGFVMDRTMRNKSTFFKTEGSFEVERNMSGGRSHSISRMIQESLRREQALTTKRPRKWTFYSAAVAPLHSPQMDQIVPEVGINLCLRTIDLSFCTNGRPLVFVAMRVLDNIFGLVAEMNLNKSKLMSFLVTIEDGYHPHNPYHNNVHAADVTARFSAIIYQCKLHQGVLSSEELLAGILSAIIHDYQHPGVNNAFQESAQTTISKQFNDISVLENASLVTALDLLDQPETSFMEDITNRQFRSIRKLVISAVLATDLAEHFNALSDFNTKIPSGPFQSSSTTDAEQRRLLLRIALKCADIGHTTLDKEHHVLWVKSLQAEFYQQGDRERELGLPVSFLMDRKKPRNGPAHGEQQLGFFDIICKPMYQAWVDRFPSCQILSTHLEENRKFWKDDAMMHKEDLEALLSKDKLASTSDDSSSLTDIEIVGMLDKSPTTVSDDPVMITCGEP